MSGYLSFVLAAAALALLTVGILLQPWWRGALRRRAIAGDAQGVERRALNAAIYRDQLAELERDRASGTLDDDAFTEARNEIKRRLLDDAALPATAPAAPAAPDASAGVNAAQSAPAGKSKKGHKKAAAQTAAAAAAPAVATSRTKPTLWLAILLLVPLSAASIYLQLGSPSAVLDAGVQAQHARNTMEDAVAKLAARLEAEPNNPEGWAMLARSYGALARWEDAATAFSRVGPTLDANAGLLAALAEVEFHRAGENFNEASRARIAQALAIDGTQLHALLLAGSDAMRSQRWADAAGYWQRLLTQLEPGSEDYNEVSAMFDEARSKAGPNYSGGDTAPNKATGAKAAAAAAEKFVTGQVAIAPELASRVKADDVVFLFARAVAEGNVPAPRMPLAVLKLTAGELPREFRLDDAMAMTPEMKLSSFAQVRIEAHIARAGTPKVESGDLIGASAPVKPGTRGIRVVIDTVAP